ncbi:EAL domain-containing protein [Falsochrobactrum sp. TDYN1]|uniref:EAL domain-containing protein n=1 Tax=Falsochrobactrum tianjinense TaxID=2706015 RepID=A0A949PN80_9HYPH|nr:EAL domain-containing protein [Falsochrobactrum sp. TDYN1]MBV2143762.1 EAL domain-containing protein [Falsochrobactrum sp. TDYN1]
MIDQHGILCDCLESAVIDAICDNRICVAIQGVHSVTNVDHMLYGECLARLLARDGCVHNAGDFIPVLDSRGSTPVLDRHMVKLVLDELAADSRAVLGCNISADSVADEAAWLPIEVQLKNRSYLADRLILEVTETRPLRDVTSANKAFRQARQLGCRIAIDDFGRGHITPGQLLSLEVDIVKIDALFVQNIKESKEAGTSLHHMVGLARCAAPIVVVEGVETSPQLVAAVMSRATHAQGFLLSQPVIMQSYVSATRTSTEG